MNTLALFRASVVTAVFAAVCPLSLAQSVTDAVRVEVRVKSDQDRRDLQGTRTDTVTQKRTLEMVLRGKPKTPETRTAKWTVYGRALKGKDLIVLESGQFPLSLAANGEQKFESKVVETTFTPAHTVTVNRWHNKKVEAEGSKYVGYKVEIKDGEKTVGLAVEPQGLQAGPGK